MKRDEKPEFTSGISAQQETEEGADAAKRRSGKLLTIERSRWEMVQKWQAQC